MDPKLAIHAENVTKNYKLYNRNIDRVLEALSPIRRKYHTPFNALNNVSLDVEKGETIGIIGRNGSGKSTLLQVLCGIATPNAGTVETRGRITALLELGTSFHPRFSGRNNIQFYGALYGLSKQELKGRFAEIEAFADIGRYIDQPVRTYSSGMYVRLAFSVAAHLSPEILIVDEALAVGDAHFQAKCYAKFREFQKKGITILIVSHDLTAIGRYCNRAYLLNDGEIYHQGTPKSVIDVYTRLLGGFSKPTQSEPPTAPAQATESRGVSENRYGDGRARITTGEITTVDGQPASILMHGQTYVFRYSVEFNDTIEDPILAYTIKDLQGLEISGTNTFYQQIDTGTYRAGDRVDITFTHKMRLNPGEYLLSFGCAGYETGQYVIYDRRFDYLAFRVVSNGPSVGLIDLESEIELSRRKLRSNTTPRD